jgi:hypothetical protein
VTEVYQSINCHNIGTTNTVCTSSPVNFFILICPPLYNVASGKFTVLFHQLYVINRYSQIFAFIISVPTTIGIIQPPELHPVPHNCTYTHAPAESYLQVYGILTSTADATKFVPSQSFKFTAPTHSIVTVGLSPFTVWKFSKKTSLFAYAI